jgi:hypothetical protein
MRTTIERLPDGSDWVAILRGPIVLASPAGTNNMTGLRARDARMGHVASGPMVPLDQVPNLLSSATDLPKFVVSATDSDQRTGASLRLYQRGKTAALAQDRRLAKSAPNTATDAGPLNFRLVDIVEPQATNGLALMPFYLLQNQRYQMYWHLTSKQELASSGGSLAADERAKAARDAATLDSVAVGEQQPEVEHNFSGEGVETGLLESRHWRQGRWFQYTLNPRGEKAIELSVTYSGSDRDRNFDILANGKLLATEHLTGSKPGQVIEKRYSLPAEILTSATDARLTIKFAAPSGLTASVLDVRLMRK